MIIYTYTHVYIYIYLSIYLYMYIIYYIGIRCVLQARAVAVMSRLGSALATELVAEKGFEARATYGGGVGVAWWGWAKPRENHGENHGEKLDFWGEDVKIYGMFAMFDDVWKKTWICWHVDS